MQVPPPCEPARDVLGVAPVSEVDPLVIQGIAVRVVHVDPVRPEPSPRWKHVVVQGQVKTRAVGVAEIGVAATCVDVPRKVERPVVLLIEDAGQPGGRDHRYDAS